MTAVLVGTVLLVLFVSFLLGTLIYTPLKTLLPMALSEVTARRSLRMAEFFLYACIAVIAFRYLSRLLPNPAPYGPQHYSRLRAACGAIAASFLILFNGLFGVGNPGTFLAPTLVFMATLALLFRHRRQAATPPGGTVLFLRRFGSFADRAVLGSVLRAAPRCGNVSFLVAANEPTDNWDPWTLGFAGFRIFHAMSSIPRFYLSSDEAWERNVAALATAARCVVVDVSEVSASIIRELQLLAANKALGRTVFLANNTAYRAELYAAIRAAGLEPGEVLSQGLCVYRTSWPRTLLRTSLIALFLCLLAVSVYREWRPESMVHGLTLGTVLVAIMAPFFAAVAVRRVIAASSGQAIRSRIRAILERSAAEHTLPSFTTQVVEALFYAAICASVVGWLFGALMLLDIRGLTKTLQGASFSLRPNETADVASLSQLGAYIGATIGCAWGAATARSERLMYKLRPIFRKRSVLVGAFLTILGVTIGLLDLFEHFVLWFVVAIVMIFTLSEARSAAKPSVESTQG
jgi:hypothetical protein